MTKKAMKKQIEELTNENWRLTELMKFQAREAELEYDSFRADLKAQQAEEEASLRVDNAKLEAENFCLRAGEEKGAYKQLSDILKVLTTKLPTLDIKEIHAHCKEK